VRSASDAVNEPQQLTMQRLQQELTADELKLVQLIARLDGRTADQLSASKILHILEQAMQAGDLPARDLTLVLTKPFGKWRIPIDAIDRTAERVGKPVAIMGGIAPAQVTMPQQDGEQPKRDDGKADA
jgi:hypothetical protein